MRLQNFCVLCLLLLLPTFASADDDPKTLVQGLLTRDAAWTSGRFKWTREVISKNVNKKPSPKYYSFEGDSWSESFYGESWGKTDQTPKPKGYMIRANHNGYLAYYSESPPDTKELREQLKTPPDAIVVEWKKIVLSEPVPSNYSIGKGGMRGMPPFWAGGIWSPRARNWIAEHIDKFTFVGDEIIDGIPTKVVKAPLNNKYFHDTAEIFEIHHKGISKGGELRLYIAPTLGYALPRADGLTFDGSEVAQRVEQTGFKQYTDTIYLPSKTERRMVGNNVIREIYTLTDIHLVNEAIPESDFLITVPEGAEVVDMRDRQHPVLFKTTTDVEKKATNLSEVPR